MFAIFSFAIRADDAGRRVVDEALIGIASSLELAASYRDAGFRVRATKTLTQPPAIRHEAWFVNVVRDGTQITVSLECGGDEPVEQRCFDRGAYGRAGRGDTAWKRAAMGFAQELADVRHCAIGTNDTALSWHIPRRPRPK